MLQILLIILCCSVYSEGNGGFCEDIYNRGKTETCPCDIMGHQPPSEDSFPYVVSLQWRIKKRSKHICGGTLISAQKVLTAAHCAIKSEEGMYWAVAGDYDLSVTEGTEQERRVVEQIVHRNYHKIRRVHHNDVAVFLLYSPFVLNSRVQTVSIPAEPLPGVELLTVAGWGTVRDDPVEHKNLLQYVERNTASSAHCSKTIGEPIDNLTICTLSVLEGPCLGDSGAGAVHGGVVYGVVSWMRFTCYPHGGYSMLMSVYGYNQFIQTYT